MRKCGNKCLYRRVLAGALSVLLVVGTGACGGKAETGTGQAEVLTQGAEAGTGSAAQSANGSDIELQQAGSGQSGSAVSAAPVWNDMQPERSMELSYAKQFSVDYYAGGYDLIQVQDDSTYLVVPEGAAVPEGLPASITVLQKPLDHVYLAATSAMDLIAALDRTDRITLSGTKESGWYVEAAKEAMEEGTLAYAGKYSAPDYEQILSSGCDLALESTMIYHVPDVKAQLEQLKIPVFVERSSYETHPLGRMEWIRLYGVLFDEEEKAEQLLKEQAEQLDTVLIEKSTGKTVAFFYITTNGAVNVRKPGDYVAKMIELAGGSYVPQTADADENALSTMNMQMEAFYFGWAHDRAEQSDKGEWYWGGTFCIPHEVVPTENGELNVKLPCEYEHIFDKAVNWKYISVLGNAKNYGEKTITLNALESCSYGFLRHTEESYMLTCKIVPRETYDTFGILLKSDKEASGCLFLEFDKAMQRVSFLNLPMGVDPFWVQSCQAVPPATEPGPDGVRVCEKTMQIEDGKAIDVKIIVDHDMIEAFIDEQIAFTYRIYAKPEFETGIIAQDSNVEFYNLSISGK